jgi:4a-hydroxytetrahydrobiopterin dehydratase
MTDWITLSAFNDAAGADGWRVLSEGGVAFFPSDFATAADFARRIAALDGLRPGRPDIDIRHDGVTVRLITVDATGFGISRRDVELAQQISAIARDIGLSPDPSVLQSLLIVPGAPDIAAVTPFWQAVLGYVPRIDSPEEDLVDPHWRNAPFWFETMREPRAGGQGAIHVAVWVTYEEAEARVKAALAAGGRLVRDHAPQWWTLADAAGNEADISTSKDRD